MSTPDVGILSQGLASELLRLVDDYVYVARVEPDGSLADQWSNRSIEVMTGYTREELKARGGWVTVVHPDEVVRQYQLAVAGDAVVWEVRFITGSGAIRWVRNRLQPIRGADGRVTHICGVAQDLTHTVAADASIRDREKVLRDVLGALPIGVSFVDRRGRVQEVNEAGRRMWGGAADVTEATYRALNLRRTSTGESLNPDDSALTRALAEGHTTLDSELALDLPDGTSRILQTSVIPMRDAEGAVTGAICLSTDVTGRKQLEAQLLQAVRMESIGRMAGGIAHDFNNLLTIIIGCAEMSLKFGNGGEAKAEWEETLAAAQRAAQLTSQLLGFARQQPVTVRVVDLNGVVDRVQGLLRRAIAGDASLVVDA